MGADSGAGVGAGRRNGYGRSGLFLVRVWTDDAGEGADQTEEQQLGVRCHGKVQRVVDGESHPFEDGADLLKLLVAMLGKSRAERGSSIGQE